MSSSAHTAFANAKMASLSATVIRCGCTATQKAARDWHGLRNVPCPRPRATENLGVVSFWHRNPLRRLAWRLSRLFRR